PDGPTTVARGPPQFAVSLALARGDDLVFGLVYDPIREEIFTGSRGGGARLNGAPIAVSETARLEHALLATGFPYDRRQHTAFYLAFVAAALQHAQGIRRAGSAALDLCYLACGRFDAYWEWKLKPWDLAAGRLIVEEAGGRVTDFAGGPHALSGEQTAASNGRLHDELLARLREATPHGAYPLSARGTARARHGSEPRHRTCDRAGARRRRRPCRCREPSPGRRRRRRARDRGRRRDGAGRGLPRRTPRRRGAGGRHRRVH